MASFVYDPAKSARNARLRALSFDRVADFDWSEARIVADERRDYGETRFVATGYLDGRLHVVCFVPRSDGVRIVSLRKANKRETRTYEETETADE